MKPKLERVTIPSGCSIRVYNRRIPDIPFEWHHHPEFELTMTLNSRGLRFIGDHVGSYESKDLVLIPSDMPHTWASTSAIDKSLPHQAIVIWFEERWALQIADLCPEYAAVAGLVKQSAGALGFGCSEAELVLKKMPELLSDSPSVRLHATLTILTELADAEGTPLVSLTRTRRVSQDARQQLNRILDTLHERYSEPIGVEDLCEVGNMSARTLHRVFVSQFGESVSNYLRRLRVGHACMLLVETDLPISVIADRAGFRNMSNFNRCFLKTRQITPMKLRRFVQEHGRLPTSVPLVKETADSERSFILQRDKMRQVEAP
ncbi:MAG TPA: AraC family transcriptional regulator [Bryobacteraceae bacterium]|nr:AraC family transcriptional regulator [Bryobacteraceae bacterium]